MGWLILESPGGLGGLGDLVYEQLRLALVVRLLLLPAGLWRMPGSSMSAMARCPPTAVASFVPGLAVPREPPADGKTMLEEPVPKHTSHSVSEALS